MNVFRPPQPCLPKNVDPQELTFIEDDRYYIIPEGIRPVLKTFRIEVSIAPSSTCYTCVTLGRCLMSVHVRVQVLFWGLRELKRVELFEVSRPFVRIECAGHQLESEEIDNFKLHPNFKEMVSFIDVVSFCCGNARASSRGRAISGSKT